MILLASRVAIALAIGGLVTAPAEASRIFRAGQQTFLKGVDPSVASSGTCTYPSTSMALKLDASDLTTLYTDTAGTTNVTADGDPVGRWKDANGSGFYVQSAADDTTRPTYRTNGGFPYVEFDGTNDILRRTSTALGLYAAGAMTVVAAVQTTAAAQGNVASEAWNSSDTPLYLFMRNLSADFNDSNAFIRADDSSSRFAGTTLITDEMFPVSTDVVAIHTDSGTNLQGWKDGVSSTAVAYTRATTTINTFAVGGLYRSSGPAGWFNMRAYELVFYTAVLSSGDIATATTCAGLSQNRTL